MLQSVEAGLHRVGHGSRSVDVSGGGHTHTVSLFDHGPQGGQIVLGFKRLAAGGDVATAHHDFDHVAASLGPLPQPRPAARTRPPLHRQGNGSGHRWS